MIARCLIINAKTAQEVDFNHDLKGDFFFFCETNCERKQCVSTTLFQAKQQHR